MKIEQAKLIDLAERVERERPSREMDAEIAAAVGAEHGPREKVCYETRSVTYIDEVAPRFTQSLDAAMTLVPEYLAWHVSSACPRDACAAIESGDDRVPEFKGRAATPALALCAAALRAIASKGDA